MPTWKVASRKRPLPPAAAARRRVTPAAIASLPPSRLVRSGRTVGSDGLPNRRRTCPARNHTQLPVTDIWMRQRHPCSVKATAGGMVLFLCTAASGNIFVARRKHEDGNLLRTSKIMTAWWEASARPDSLTMYGAAMPFSRHTSCLTSRRDHSALRASMESQ